MNFWTLLFDRKRGLSIKRARNGHEPNSRHVRGGFAGVLHSTSRKGNSISALNRFIEVVLQSNLDVLFFGGSAHDLTYPERSMCYEQGKQQQTTTLIGKVSTPKPLYLKS